MPTVLAHSHAFRIPPELLRPQSPLITCRISSSITSSEKPAARNFLINCSLAARAAACFLLNPLWIVSICFRSGIINLFRCIIIIIRNFQFGQDSRSGGAYAAQSKPSLRTGERSEYSVAATTALSFYRINTSGKHRAASLPFALYTVDNETLPASVNGGSL